MCFYASCRAYWAEPSTAPLPHQIIFQFLLIYSRASPLHKLQAAEFAELMSPDKPSKDISLRLFSVSIYSKGPHLSREWWFDNNIYDELQLSTKTVADPNVNPINYIILIFVVSSNDDIRSISSRSIHQAWMVTGFSTWMQHCVISPWFQNNSYSSCRHIHKRSEDNINPNLMD